MIAGNEVVSPLPLLSTPFPLSPAAAHRLELCLYSLSRSSGPEGILASLCCAADTIQHEPKQVSRHSQCTDRVESEFDLLSSHSFQLLPVRCLHCSIGIAIHIPSFQRWSRQVESAAVCGAALCPPSLALRELQPNMAVPERVWWISVLLRVLSVQSRQTRYGLRVMQRICAVWANGA